MEFVVFVVLTIFSFFLSILSVRDRVLGIAGMALMFLTTAIAGGDNIITMGRAWSENLNAWQYSTVSVNPTFIIFGLVMICVEFIILYEAYERYGTFPEEGEDARTEFKDV